MAHAMKTLSERAKMAELLAKRDSYGEASSLPPTLAMQFGDFMAPAFEAAQGAFPESNPYGSAIEDFLLGSAPDSARRMAEGETNVLADTRSANPLDWHLKPEAVDMAGAVPLGLAGKAAGVGAKGAALAGALGDAGAARHRLARYADPATTKLEDWPWRPLDEVDQQLGERKVPSYITDHFGNFMNEQVERAKAGALGARDLIKAYGITRSSVQRQGLPHATAVSHGLPVEKGAEALVRPEGAFSDWLMSPPGKAYLDAAERGVVDPAAIADIVGKFKPFGGAPTLGQDLEYAAQTMPGVSAQLAQKLQAPIPEWKAWAKQFRGVGPAKNGFLASLLGRGDMPTTDARQLTLHTGVGSKHAGKFFARGSGVGGDEAMERLAARQRAMDYELPEQFAPHYQHLTHHTVWDKTANAKTTHEDLIRAMRLAGIAAPVGAAALYQSNSQPGS